MAINVDTVYKTVLLVLNKENRGYMTPDEFNKTATQVQLSIFEQYFDDLNQQLRVLQQGNDYANRQRAIEQKLAPFKGYNECVYTGVSSPATVNDKTFAIPASDGRGNTVVNPGVEPGLNQVAFYRLGTVFYIEQPVSSSSQPPAEIQLVTRDEYNSLGKSDLTAPSLFSPIFMYEDYRISVAPETVNDDVFASFIRKPKNVIWNFEIPPGQNYYQYVTNGSQDFELDASEQSELIVKILLYSGVVVKDYNLVNIAVQEVQRNEINQKS